MPIWSSKPTPPRTPGKLRVLAQLLHSVSVSTSERFVLVSNSTQTLDLFEAVLRAHSLSFARLDGSVPANKRQERVDAFNDDQSIFAFLLSSKASSRIAPSHSDHALTPLALATNCI